MENQNQSSVPPSSSPPESAPSQSVSSEPNTQNTQSPYGESSVSSMGEQGQTVATSVGAPSSIPPIPPHEPAGAIHVPSQTTPGVSPVMKIAIILLALLVVGGLGYLGFQMLSKGSDEDVDISVDDAGSAMPLPESDVEETQVIPDESMMEATPTISADTSTATIEAELNSIDIPTGDADVADLTTEASGL